MHVDVDMNMGVEADINLQEVSERDKTQNGYNTCTHTSGQRREHKNYKKKTDMRKRR